MTNLAPVPTESAVCANCSAPLAADQRYCLSCGQPVSPVRLAFLDVLESERQPQLGSPGASVMPAAYPPYADAPAGPAWLRRYAPLFAVASVLLLAMIAGLLVGHWATQSKGPTGPQVVKIEGLASAPAAAASTSPTSTPTTPAATIKPAASARSEEAKELAEARAEEKSEAKAPAKPPPAKKLSTHAVTKLEKTTGRQHEEELNKITTAPIEVK